MPRPPATLRPRGCTHATVELVKRKTGTLYAFCPPCRRLWKVVEE